MVPLRKEATRDVVFIATPGHFDSLDVVQDHYPGGELREWYDEYWDKVYLKAYLIPQEEANHPAVAGR